MFGRKRRPAAVSGARTRANVVRAAARGLQSHPLPTLQQNLNRNDAKKGKIAAALTILVGALQDFMRLSGYSLGKAVKAAVDTHQRYGRVSGALAGLLRVAPDAVFGFAVTLLFVFVVKPYRVEVSRPAVERAVGQARKSLEALLRGGEADLRPLVSAVVMSLGSVEAHALAVGAVDGILNTYVYNPYQSTGGGGAMCALCASVGKCAGDTRKPGFGVSNGSALARPLSKAFKAVNMLLAVTRPGLTLTSVARRAMDTYLREASPHLATLVRLAGPAAALSVGTVAMVVGKIGLGRLVAKYLAKFGLGLDDAALSRVLYRHLGRVRHFLGNKPGADIEPLLVDLVVSARPAGLTGGIIGAAVAKRATPEFCALCRSSYAMC